MIWAAALIGFNLLFFRRFYFVDPYCYATSEALDTAFPSSRVLGEWYRRGCRGEIDPYYYPYFSSIPFLQTFYPPNILQAVIGTFLPLDAAFILFSFYMVSHFLLASIGAYFLFGGGIVGLFGAITFAYMGYNVKQNACINCTVAWTPWLLLGASTHNPILFGIALAMGTLAGYWPLWIYLVPMAGFWMGHESLDGILIGASLSLPQIWLAVKYYPKSVRSGKSAGDKTSIGCINLKMLLEGAFPGSVTMGDSVFSTEYTYSVGILGLMLAVLSPPWLLCLTALFYLLASGTALYSILSPFMLRIPARWTYFMGVCLAIGAVYGFREMPPKWQAVILLLQAWNLCITHSHLWPMQPFCQRTERPSHAFGEWKNLPVPHRIPLPYPVTTGQIHHQPTLGYCGGAALQAMSILHGNTDPNGCADHSGSNMSAEDYKWWTTGQKTWADLEARYGK